MIADMKLIMCQDTEIDFLSQGKNSTSMEGIKKALTNC
jgi:hypothetical protein